MEGWIFLASLLVLYGEKRIKASVPCTYRLSLLFLERTAKDPLFSKKMDYVSKASSSHYFFFSFIKPKMTTTFGAPYLRSGRQ